MKTFKIRASAAGQIMTNPRAKSELLSETTKSYVYDWLKEQIYGYRKDISGSKYIQKGLMVEDAAIEYAFGEHAKKNEEYFEDDFFTGTPDLILGDKIVDIKSSWSCDTFPLFEQEIPTKGYELQLQVYMHLTGLKNAQLVYVLMNTPEDIEWEQPRCYDHLDVKYRIKSYDVEYNPQIIEDIQQRVLNIREFITTLQY